MEEQKVYRAKVVNDKKNCIWQKLIIAILLIMLGALGMYSIMKFNPSTTVVNKLEKEVTVTDTGIADSVEKIYNAVVVVENYKGNTLYATGTGFIFKKDNNKYYVMTNYHVIENGTTIKIVLTDDTRIEVENVGGDMYADIAVLSFNSKEDLSIASLGSSTDGRVGDTVFAVGAPINSATYSWTVTRGILSGKDRMVSVAISSAYSSDYIMRVLQTDTAINSGNSGGPLCNSNGEVIGVTNMKISSSGVEGIGFAIPIEDANDFATKIINGEDITRPYLGIKMTNVTTVQNYYNITLPNNVSSGVYVVEVEASSVAEEAGLKSGDIIIEFDNIEIEDQAKLKYELYRHSIGDTVTIKINRNGFEKELSLTLSKKAS